MLVLIRKKIDQVFAVVLSIAMMVLVALALWQVFTRYVLNNPSLFTEELLRFAMIWMALLGAAYAFSGRKHMALVFLREKMQGARRTALIIATDLLVIFFAASVMVYGGTFLASRTIHVITPVLGWSMGVVYCVIPISGVLIIALKIMDMLIYIKQVGE